MVVSGMSLLRRMVMVSMLFDMSGAAWLGVDWVWMKAVWLWRCGGVECWSCGGDFVMGEKGRIYLWLKRIHGCN